MNSIGISFFRLFSRLFLVTWAVGCASTPTFKDQPVVWRVSDQLDMAEPSPRRFRAAAYYAKVFALRASARVFELHDLEPAANTNALDEVPNSTWFQNRIGVRAMAAAEAARGPVLDGPPKLPLTVWRGKDTGGGNPGFFARDSTDRLFLIKFDTRENPEMQTATSVIVNRVFWAAGYNVPEDTLIEFGPDDIVLSSDAQTEDKFGNKIAMTPAHVSTVLATAPRNASGRYRASASRFLPGVPKGGFAMEGRRDGDPNDRVEHQHRRELRAIRVFAAWLGHTDMKEDNTLDMFVEEDGRHFLRHYLLDFGEAMGAHQAEKGRLEDGYEHLWDWQDNTAAVFTFGLWKKAWEDQQQTPWPSIGAFSAKWFEPEEWKEAYPYWPFHEADAADLYWGAKLVMRFDRAMLKAIVAEGQLSHPAAAKYLLDTLIGRRDKIGRTWLDAVSSFDYLHMDAGRLCGVDLGVRFGLAQTGALVLVDEAGETLDEIGVAANGDACLPIADDDAYRILRLRTRRGHHLRPTMQIHYRGGEQPRILGVIRIGL